MAGGYCGIKYWRRRTPHVAFYDHPSNRQSVVDAEIGLPVEIGVEPTNPQGI